MSDASKKLLNDPPKGADDPADGTGFGAQRDVLRRLFANHPGPALLFDRGADAYGLNDAGDALAETLAADGGVTMMPQLVQLAVKARISGAGMTREVEMPDGRSRLEATVLPQADGTLLMLARDATLDASIRNALAESRTRFKDLVDLAADFAWETDAEGRFTYLSPRGVIGFPADSLIGKNPADMLVDADTAPTPLPFAARETARNIELWMTGADAQPRCLLVSAAPVREPGGERMGARGIAIDVTTERLQQSELAQLKAREQLVQYILDALRGEVEPEEMLHAAARALGRTMSAAAAVLRIVERDRTVIEGRFGEPPDDAEIDAAAERMRRSESVEDGSTETRRWLGVAARHGDDPVGVISIWRRTDAGDWTQDDRALLRAVERQFGIAFRQIADQQQLERLSRTDDLTGLSNRRAFFEDLAVSLQRCVRRGESGALLYIDLDDFKPINDTFGHERGDRVLTGLADALVAGTRGYDLTARIGGDEFAVWLEGADEGIARARAEDFIAAVRALADTPPDGTERLGASVGIALFAPDAPDGADGADAMAAAEDVGALLARADAAMYNAKRQGKSRVGLGPSAAEEAVGKRAARLPEDERTDSQETDEGEVPE